VGSHFCDTLEPPHMIAPRLKRVSAISHSGLQPKTPENVAKHGWKTVVVRKKGSPRPKCFNNGTINILSNYL
jgi:hypothetical protein